MKPDSNTRPKPDALLLQLANYTTSFSKPSAEAVTTARYCLMDSIGCAILALNYPECVRVLGPIVPDTKVPLGIPVPGTSHVLDPVMAAFNIGTLVRWLDFNDTWLAAEWGHPSDNLGAILAVADWRSRQNLKLQRPPLTMGQVLRAMIKAHEIQGVLAFENSFNRLGFDHVLLVRIASTAVATWLMGGSHTQIVNALSNAWVDGGVLRTYRHAPNTGRRKSWAAGDATARAVLHAWMALREEMGYPSVLTTPRWGFHDVMMRGQPLKLSQPLGCYVMEHVLFKISFPAEFHAQTAVEAALQLHPQIIGRLTEITEVIVHTQDSAMRIINKSGPLRNPADRDHCLQYMVAVGLIFGKLTADHYEDEIASDPRIDALRKKMRVVEDPRYSCDYLDPSKRSIANAVQVKFRQGKPTAKVEVEYPVGHRRRRAVGIPLLQQKFRQNLATQFAPKRVEQIVQACEDPKFGKMPVSAFMDLLAVGRTVR